MKIAKYFTRASDNRLGNKVYVWPKDWGNIYKYIQTICWVKFHSFWNCFILIESCSDDYHFHFSLSYTPLAISHTCMTILDCFVFLFTESYFYAVKPRSCAIKFMWKHQVQITILLFHSRVHGRHSDSKTKFIQIFHLDSEFFSSP